MDKATEQQVKLSQLWDGYLYNELIQKAMLEIESRAPLRRLKPVEKWTQRALGLRRGI